MNLGTAPKTREFVPGGNIPRVETKKRECWKFLDSRLNSENDSRVHGQPSFTSHGFSFSSSFHYHSWVILLFILFWGVTRLLFLISWYFSQDFYQFLSPRKYFSKIGRDKNLVFNKYLSVDEIYSWGLLKRKKKKDIGRPITVTTWR